MLRLLLLLGVSCGAPVGLVWGSGGGWRCVARVAVCGCLCAAVAVFWVPCCVVFALLPGPFWVVVAVLPWAPCGVLASLALPA